MIKTQLIILGLPGYEAHAQVGRRHYVYHAHGQEFAWTADIGEEIMSEQFVYWKELFCNSGNKYIVP